MATKQSARFLDYCRPGDPVEVRKLVAGGVRWERATIEYIDRNRLVATLADGARMSLVRSGLDVRLPQG